MQPMPHGRPGFHAVIVFSECELMFKFAICYRRSVCLSSVCLSSVTLVRPTQPVEIFGNVSSAFGTLGPRAQGTPPSGDLNAKGVAKYSDF